MKLQVLLSALVPAWLLLLDQEKVPYSIREENKKLISQTENFQVFILAKRDPSLRSEISAYLKRGGAVIVDTDTYEDVRGLNFPERIFTLDISVRKTCESWKALKKDFSLNGITVSEVVAVQKKSTARAAVRKSLQKAFWSQGLPYVHLGYYPQGYRNVFSFRFDMDEYDAESHLAFCQTLEKYRGFVSCFACLRTFAPVKDALDRVVQSGVEVGSHGYVHHVYQDYVQNKVNFKYAEQLLEQHSVPITGFTAPHGTWHPTLQRVLEENGYLYSSEFSFDYDNFPFFPIVQGRTSCVLQIPTHPVCEGVFFDRYTYEETMLRNYFDTVIDHKIQIEEPLLFFGHPDRRIGKHPEILTNILNRVNAHQGIWKTEFRSWSRWWIKRHGLSFVPEYTNGKIRTLGMDHTDDCPVEIFFPDGRREFMQHHATSISTTVKNDPYSPVSETTTEEGFPRKIKLLLKKWLDWETKTPPEILKTTNFRTAAKRLLRLFWRSSI